ncbi:MAG: hypothetical protein AB1295_03975 [Candidatus Micrarchaeota archaeon]
MTDLRRTIRCSNCGIESSVTVSSDIDVKELLFSGKCRCGSSMQVTYNIVGESQSSSQPESPSSVMENGSSSSSDDVVNLEESLFGTETPSDTLKDIMED